MSEHGWGAEDRLRDWVLADFGVDLGSVHPVGMGTDAGAQLWRATAADGSRYAVTLSGGGTPAGLVVAAHLAERGVSGIAGRRPRSDREQALAHVRGVLWPARLVDRALASLRDSGPLRVPGPG